jgi:3-oxoacyl-[acyl-carrier-protein] synthase II
LKYGIIGEHLAEHFGTEGSPISLNTACASGGSDPARRRGDPPRRVPGRACGRRRRLADAGVAGALLAALGAVDAERSARAGVKAVLQEPRRLRAGRRRGGAGAGRSRPRRGARRRVLGILEGCGEKSDSFHRTRSSPDGKPIIACMRNALADAGIGPEDVDYINAHGTSTPENDKMEHLGVSTVFGERIRNIPISSNKSMIGHTLTAAGAVEAVFTLLTLEHQRIPPTINHTFPIRRSRSTSCPMWRATPGRRAISNSFGFGGQNVCLVMALEPA